MQESLQLGVFTRVIRDRREVSPGFSYSCLWLELVGGARYLIASEQCDYTIRASISVNSTEVLVYIGRSGGGMYRYEKAFCSKADAEEFVKEQFRAAEEIEQAKIVCTDMIWPQV